MKDNWFCLTGTLDERQICFVDKLSRQARFTGGRKLSRTVILRALLKATQKLHIDVCEVKGEGELECRFLNAFKKYE